ncbi:MAG: hypothetical protein H7319_02975 [Spirosoma sp.]|nr:hypothetical protein [Spirosoma sp.]
MITQIKTVADVQTFAHQLVAEGLTGGFHPDDPFEDFTGDDGLPLYTTEEAATRNTLMEQCFDVCGDDVHEVIGRITLSGTPFESIFDKDHEERYNTFMQLVDLGIKDYKPNGVSSRAVKETVFASYN